jgi:hypothetical protein
VTHGEANCGEVHWFIPEAIACVAKHNRSREEFGSFIDGVNLWWGTKQTPRMSNIGFVIGLRNEGGGIGWRLDYDNVKGGHINQVYRVPGQKRWAKICHLIDFGSDDSSWYGPWFWVLRQWYQWTEINWNLAPPRLVREVQKRMAYPPW